MKRNLLFFVLLSAVACSKSSDPVSVDPPKQLISKVYHYNGNDTTLAPLYVDSLEYNNADQVTKIRVYSMFEDTIVYTFSYNGNGDVSQMHVTSQKTPSQDNYYYYLSYRSDKKLDSIREVNATETFVSTFNYNAQQVLTEVSTYTPAVAPANLIYRSSYYRSSQIDSINSENYQTGINVNRRINTEFVDPAPALAINKTYMLMLAQRFSFRSLFLPGIYNPGYIHQFVNPKELILRNGSTMEYKPDFRPPNLYGYKSTFWVNPAGNVRLYRYYYSQGISSSLDAYINYKFEYISK